MMDDEIDVELMLDTCEEYDDVLSRREREFIDECQFRLSEYDSLPAWRLEMLKVLYNRVKLCG